MNTTLASQFASEFDKNNLLIEGNCNQDELVHELICDALTNLNTRIVSKNDVEAILETVNIYDLIMATCRDDKYADVAALKKYAIDVEGLDEDEVEELCH